MMLKILWFVLIVLGVASWLVHGELWMFAWRPPLMALLCLASIVVAITIAMKHGFALRPTVLVIVALVIGQWWPTVFAATLLLWSVGGFAP